MTEPGGSMGSPPKKSPIDTLINNLTGDMHQSYDGQYMVLGQPPQNQSQGNMWQPTTSEINPIQQPPIFKPQQQAPPSMYYSNMQGHGDFMSYGNHSHYQTNLQNSFLQQQYQHQQVQPPMMNDFALFANRGEQRLPNQHNQHSSYPSHQLIDNLVGNWAPNQSGTYSPFGNLGTEFGNQLGTDFGNQMNSFTVEKEERQERGPVFADMPRQESLLAATRRPRAVAEVRPMRPSYSAVLTKSPPAAPVGNKTRVAAQPVKDAKAKPGKGKKMEGDTKVNPASSLKRQHSGGSEEVKPNSASVAPGASKLHQNQSSQWSSLDSANNSGGGTEEYGENEEGKFNRKESGRRSKRNKNKYHGLNEEEEEVEGEYYEGEKGGESVNGVKPAASGAKRQNIPSGNLQWGVRETESSVNHRSTAEKKKIEGDKKKATGEVGGKGGRKKEGGNAGGGGSKKTPRPAKKRDGHAHMIAMMMKQWHAECCRLAVLFAAWFFNLVWDIVAMSSSLMVYLLVVLMEFFRFWGVSIRLKLSSLLAKKWWTYSFPWRKKRPKLSKNISLPSTGDEAIRRLLSCKEKDPYSILGVAPDCTDDDIKKYYRRQAILVHPDKNHQAGAEEAFKTLAHAFDLIGEPETRQTYDRRVTESTQAEQAWSELNELLSKLSQKVEIATNTIRCTHCGGRHRRVLMDRPSYAARFCAQCKIHHSAREGDIWAESWGLGLLWHYYACMETSVYDITEWAACQAVNLKHLKANSHSVQYRIVVGRQHPPPPSPSHHSHHPHCPNGSSDPDIDDFLNTLYQSSNGGATSSSGLCSEHSHMHHSHPRARKKQGKKKK